MSMQSLHKFYRCALISIGVLLMVSCSLIYDDMNEDTDVMQDDSCYITLTISTTAPGTRSVVTMGGGLYDDGTDTDYENYIDIAGGDYRFYLFRADDANPVNETFITEIRAGNPFLVPESNGNSSKTYRIICKVDPHLFDGVMAYKAVFVCNWGKKGDTPNYPNLTPDVSTIADVQATFDYTQYWTLGINGPTTPNSHLIPMYGVTNTFNCSDANSKIVAGQCTDMGTLHLLRAMAKIEVTISDNETDDIESIELIGFNSTGYCAPQGVNKQSDYFGDDYVYANDFLHTPSLVNNGSNNSGSNTQTRHFGFKEATATSPRVFTIYVPEYRNENADKSLATDAASLKITFSDGDVTDYRLDFKSTQDGLPYTGYKEGDAFNLLRNSYYKYTVKRTDNRTLIAEVHPYFTVTLNPQFGIETGIIIWEGMWSVTSATIGTIAMNDLKLLLYDWSQVSAGHTLSLYMLSREQEGISATDYENQFMVQLLRFETADGESKFIPGLNEQYYRPENGVLNITLTQDILNDIIAHNGISITGQYFILYRVTIR